MVVDPLDFLENPSELLNMALMDSYYECKNYKEDLLPVRIRVTL